MVTANALRIVLDRGPKETAFLYDVLKVCLSYGITQLSCSALTAALSHAVLSLSDLTAMSSSSGLKSIWSLWNSYSGNAREFAQALVVVLDASAERSVWWSRPVWKVSQELYAKDFPAFAQLGIGAMSGYRTLPPAEQRKVRDLSDRWAQLCLKHLVSPCEPPCAEDLIAARGFIASCYLEQVAIGRPPRPINSEAEPPSNNLISLSIHVAKDDDRTHRHPDSQSVLAFMRQIKVTTSCCRDLVILLLQPGSPDLAVTRRRVNSYTAFLRRERLFELEASLLACTLHTVESPAEISPSISIDRFPQDSEELHQWRESLIKGVEKAERRSFGNRDGTKQHQQQSSTKPKRFRREDALDCWTMKTPTPKKPRIIPGKDSFGLGLRARTLSSRCHQSGSPLVKKRRSMGPRNFGTLLGDTLSNRAKLHSSPQIRRGGFSASTSTSDLRSSLKRHSVGAMHTTEPLISGSDDELDLFAYGPASSPTCLRR